MNGDEPGEQPLEVRRPDDETDRYRAALIRIAFGDCDSLWMAAAIAGDALRQRDMP